MKMTSTACKTTPAIVLEGYKPRGVYETVSGLNTYVTGPKNATSGIVDIYDVFGFSSQTLQGADILAARTNSIVIIPDFFNGESVSHDWLPADSEEKKTLLTKFLSEKAAYPQNVGLLLGVAEDCKKRFPCAKKWAAFGLCWGGKVAVLASGSDSPFVASGQTHPGSIDKADAQKLTIPHIVLASKDEPAEVILAYKEILEASGKDGLVETYSSMWHGWMGARANLTEDDGRKQYMRG
ncbi:uncharacterized protein A1O9_00836 [Exophiala aquamarina CBS 119918]|uniref:Dienelactone hydrolase domain-containing protein n=1 Tax=Exophiala aquamarina CBS 119918 TaxID=1182545 RepID=A0A072PU54_9EURO|nr:uncharacterized protein A1O9_00836 [Exophiala aquamarina CBS 119918]KEF62863.1 hypothetical protein A1O9_00836 [Exophiala aquamarina CBS 119918]